MKYKPIPLLVAEEDYDRVMKLLTFTDKNDGCIGLVGDYKNNFSSEDAFGVKFKLGKKRSKK